MTPVTFTQALPRLAVAFGGAQGVTDARVMTYANYAQESIINKLGGLSATGKPYTPRGVWVGGVDQLTLTVATGQLITLPATHEVILEIEIVNAQDVNNGWYSDLDMTGLVDPDFAQDVLAIPQGLDNSGNRIYMIPAATVGDTVKVMAKKRYAPVTAGTDLLCVPNVEAVANMMKAIYKSERNDNKADALNYEVSALNLMAAQLSGYLADPTRSQMRKAAYLADEKTYAPGALGYTRARLALELPNALKIGKTNLTRGINRIVERLVQRTNELRTAGRLRVKTGLNNLTFTRASLPTDVLTITDYEQIRTMATAFLDPSVADANEKRAYDLLEAEETNALETLRHTTYSALLETMISQGKTNTLGYFSASFALDPSHPEWLKLSDDEMERRVNIAVRDALQVRNSLTATELYSNVDGPDIRPFVYSRNSDDVLPYADFEAVQLFLMSQEAQGAELDTLKANASTLIERNLAKVAASERNSKWHCLLDLPRFTFGWMRAKVGLGLSERGFSFSDQKIGRMINDAEDALCRTPNFKNGEGMYTLVSDSSGLIALPPDAERIIYADICGLPLTVKHRSFEYLPIPSGYGVQPNFFSTLANWTVIGPFGYRGRAALQDRGFDADGNRIYYVQGCWVVDFNQVDGSSAGANINVVVKRKFVTKVADDDVMLVQNVDAIRQRVEAEIARLDGNLSNAASLKQDAAAALDDELLNEKAGEVITPRFVMPGRSAKGGVRTLYRRRF